MTLQGRPVAEVNVTAGIVSVVFDDNQSQDADAINTHLKLRGQKLDLLLEVMQGAVATKVSLLQVVCLSPVAAGCTYRRPWHCARMPVIIHTFVLSGCCYIRSLTQRLHATGTPYSVILSYLPALGAACMQASENINVWTSCLM